MFTVILLMAIPTLLQKVGASGGAGNVSSVTATYTNATQATSSLLVCTVAQALASANNPVTSVTDNYGNNWQLFPGSRQNGQASTWGNVEVWYCQNAVGGSNHQVTVKLTQAARLHVGLIEYAKAHLTAAADWAVGGNGTGLNVTSGSMNTNINGLVYVGVLAVGNVTVTRTEEANWTDIFTGTSAGALSSSAMEIGDGTSQPPGSYAATWTLGTSQNWVCVMVTFAPAETPGRGGVTFTYVDGSLGANILNGNYSVANRNSGGYDGNAYTTHQGAFGAVPSYQEVITRSGTYKEFTTTTPSLTIPSGTTWVCMPGESVNITYDSGAPPYASGQGAPLINFSGTSLTVNGNLQGSITVSAAGTTLSKTSGMTFTGTLVLDNTINAAIQNSSIFSITGGKVLIQNCELTSWGHCAVKWPNNVTDSQDVSLCWVHDGGYDSNLNHGFYAHAPDNFDKRIHHNCIHGCTGYGVHCYDVTSYWNVYTNFIFGNGTGGILAAGSNMQFVGNTVVNNGTNHGRAQGGIVLFDTSPAMSNNTIKNNIFWGNYFQANVSADVNALHAQGTGNTFDHNIWGTIINSANWTAISTNDINNNPLFVGATGPNVPVSFHDCRIGIGSGAKGAGVYTGEPYNHQFEPAAMTWPPRLVVSTNPPDIGAAVFG